MLCCSGCSVVVQVAAAPMRYWRLFEIQGHALLSASWAGLCTSLEGYPRAMLTMMCIGAFARVMHPLIRARYVLITHNSGSQTLHPTFSYTFARMCTSAAQDVWCLSDAINGPHAHAPHVQTTQHRSLELHTTSRTCSRPRN